MTLRYILLYFLLLLTISIAAQDDKYATGAWGSIDSEENSWATNLSRPNKINNGLQGRHVSIAASHGRYYDGKKWEWQRPNLFCTREDLYTQTIVVPFLMPMLENAGCYVFSPRERDWQTNEVIVDNDQCTNAFTGSVFSKINVLEGSKVKGFAQTKKTYKNGDSPFTDGTAEIIPTSKGRQESVITYTPNIPESGKYAVYVSYPEVNDAIDDVRYTVVHKGVPTLFSVNQQMGWGTWVYLGTFEFEAGCSANNMVFISASSKAKGHIGIDAVRFGGGMGNIDRGCGKSGLPRCLEAARYNSQWAGAPKSIYDSRDTDYNDDIATRPLMTNWVAGGSCFVPDQKGLRVPIELSLAVHSDAGFSQKGDFTGTLGIATTDHNNGKLAAGINRKTSVDFAHTLVNNINRDMLATFGKWRQRSVWDKNYGETRMPAVPSAIIEMHSHQNFPEMAIGQDPMGKFTLARSIYKSIARYVSDQHNQKCVIQPLAPTDFRVEMMGGNKVKLSWTAVDDPQESTAHPKTFNVYVAMDNLDFDNGTNTKKKSMTIKMLPGVQYNFRVTACNDGGESFPTEILSAYISKNAVANIMVVNGFQRLAAPYSVDNSTTQGFYMSRDEGVQYGTTYNGFTGDQKDRNRQHMGKELGTGGTELEGKIIAGNDFSYVRTHTEAIANTRNYNVVSCSSTALESGLVSLKHIDCMDFAFGLQKDYDYQFRRFKTFTPNIRRQLAQYIKKGGRLFASGAYLGSDMMKADEQDFTRSILKYSYQDMGERSAGGSVMGLGMQFDYYNKLNDKHYAAVHPESLQPVGSAFTAMTYSNGMSAAVAYKDKHTASFVMGLPFECIKDKAYRYKVMAGILNFLLTP